MELILKQRRFFTKKLFEIADKSLKISVSNTTSSVDEEIGFENITTKITTRRAPKTVPLIFSLLTMAGLIVCVISHFTQKDGSTYFDILFYLIPFVICVLITYLTYESEIKLLLTFGTYVSFYSGSPDKQTVQSFLSLLKIKQKEYLLNRYAVDDKLLTQERLASNLRWLLERNIIDDSELSILKEKLLILKPENVKTVGFTFGSN